MTKIFDSIISAASSFFSDNAHIIKDSLSEIVGITIGVLLGMALLGFLGPVKAALVLLLLILVWVGASIAVRARHNLKTAPPPDGGAE